MTYEPDPDPDVFVICPDIRKHTGFAVNGRLVCYALAEEYDVANVSEHAFRSETVDVRGRDVTILPCDQDGGSEQYGDVDFGDLVDEYEPRAVVSVMNVRMVAHIPEHRLPVKANLRLRKLGTHQYEIGNIVQRTQEALRGIPSSPRFEWIGQIPIDGHPLPDFYGGYLNEMSSVVSMSEYGKRVLDDQFDVDAFHIPHAVDAPIDYPDTSGKFDDGDFVIGAVNANDYRKQHSRLIEAVGKFYRRAGEPDDVSFYIHTGRSDHTGFDINALLNSNGIADITEPYEGPVERPELMALYEDFDVFASATAGEGFGLTVAEALWANTPVVITDYTTSAELVEDGDPSPRGRLVEPAVMYDEPYENSTVKRALVDTDAFADALHDYYARRKRAERHGENAKEWARENLRYEDVAGAWLSHVRNVLGD